MGFFSFKCIAFLTSNFLAQALQGTAFFFSADIVNEHWFFVNTVRNPFLCTVCSVDPDIRVFARRSSSRRSSSMPSCLGVMQWLIKGLCVSPLCALALAPVADCSLRAARGSSSRS